MMANNEETSALYDEAGPPKNYVPRRRRSSLFSQLLPEPSRPRSSLRSLSTGILVAFLCFIVWTALVGNSTGSTGAQAEQGWVHYAGVSDWARMDPSRFDFNGEDTFKEKGRPSAVGVGEETTTDEEVDTSRALSMRVAEAVEDGTVSKYRWHAQLSTRNTSVGDAGRMIVVGDVHGMHASLTSLLARIDYNNLTDTLIHVGDLVAKSPLNDSLESVRIMRNFNSNGVRGNHDQSVIEWRNWMEMYGERSPTRSDDTKSKAKSEATIPEGRIIERRKVAFPWLSSGKVAEAEEGPSADVSTLPNHSSLPSISSLSLERADEPLLLSDKHSNHSVDHDALAMDGALLGASWSWLDLESDELAKEGIVVPKLWTGKTRGWGGDHFEIARHLPRADFEYLMGLPLTLHLEGLNTYVVHAGMLPWTDNSESRMQSPSPSTPSPLPALLNSTSKLSYKPTEDTAALLSTPERSLLSQVAANTNPFTLLNMRGVRSKKHSSEMVVTKESKGTPWYQIWNEGMLEHCAGKENCNPVNLIYGHWAGKGLTIQPNSSVGLDSGCVYGNRLSALVFSSSPTPPLSSTLVERQENGDSETTTPSSATSRQMRPAVGSSTTEDDSTPSTEEEESVQSDSDEETPAKDSPKEFDQEAVELAGKKGWIVSVSCA